MKTKGLETYFYSTVGVAAMFLLVLALNVIAARAKVRLDLTSERAYTLSQGTRNILSKLDTPVQIRFYCTRGENRMPVQLKSYAERVEDLLNEYRQASKGFIEIQKLDPQPDSDAEDSAKLDGVEGEALPDGDKVYLGVSVTMLDQKEVLPFLAPDRERLLEYDLSRALSRVMLPEKPVIGVFSPLPISGESNPMMMQMGRRGQPAWAFYTELKRDFTLKTIEANADKIPDEVKVLLVIHPKAISETAQYAIDQFVLRGGKMLAFVDPLAVLDSQSNPMMGGGPSVSSLDKLLKAWGMSFDSQKVVADMTYVARTRQGRSPGVLALTEQAMNKDDIVTADIDNLVMVFAGSFSGTPMEGLKETVLVKSSKDSELVDPMAAEMGGEQIIKEFKASGTEFPLAIRLAGKFKTAFPEGKPKAAEPPAADKKPEEKKDEKDASLKESTADSAVILVGDSDMLQDQVAVTEVMNPFGGGQRMVMPSNGNLAFAQGAIEQLSGDSNLISIRSRATRERPFKVVKDMQAAAEAEYQSKIKELEASLQTTQQELNDLQRAKGEQKGQRFILSPDQQKKITEFRKKEADVKLQLKQLRKQLKAKVDSLETWTKWMNIAAMPFVVAVSGIVLAVNRRKKQAAR